ncbi:Uncharacterised protein [Mycobacteroides abscessus subsp. abscessus]|nr:Uncharacterised protein [Mycobacteroides abscessus subsp. abscessus]
MRSTTVSSGTTKHSTASSLEFMSPRIFSSASAWSTVRGYPSRTNPLAASGSFTRASTMRLVTSLGTRSPASMYFWASRPSGVCWLMFARNRSPVEMCGTPSFSDSRTAWVPLPAPGGPSSTTLT